MNSSQRKFLVDKITEKTKAKIKALENQKPDRVSLNLHMLHKVMSDDFEIKSTDDLKKLVLEKALKTTDSGRDREDWLGNSWGSSSRGRACFDLHEFFVIPEEYMEITRKNNEAREKIEEEIRALQIHLDTLEVRIMLASDSVLQKIINEVDDMGDIKLIDTKIKLLN